GSSRAILRLAPVWAPRGAPSAGLGPRGAGERRGGRAALARAFAVGGERGRVGHVQRPRLHLRHGAPGAPLGPPRADPAALPVPHLPPPAARGAPAALHGARPRVLRAVPGPLERRGPDAADR